MKQFSEDPLTPKIHFHHTLVARDTINLLSLPFTEIASAKLKLIRQSVHHHCFTMTITFVLQSFLQRSQHELFNNRDLAIIASTLWIPFANPSEMAGSMHGHIWWITAPRQNDTWARISIGHAADLLVRLQNWRAISPILRIIHHDDAQLLSYRRFRYLIFTVSRYRQMTFVGNRTAWPN